MSKRYIDGPALPSVTIRGGVYTGTAGGSVFGLIFANAPIAGAAVGAVVGLALGWCLRNVGTQPNSPESSSKSE
jgi:uncharacterized membrane protein